MPQEAVPVADNSTCIATGDTYVVDLNAGSKPKLIESLRGESIQGLAGGFARTAVLTCDGVARSVGPSSAEATELEELSGLRGQTLQVAFGLKHTSALSKTAKVYTVGDGSSGQLGHGSMANDASPRLVKSLDRWSVVQVVCGEGHSLALTADGNVYSWGDGEKGQLGLGRMGAGVLQPRYVATLQVNHPMHYIVYYRVHAQY